ncbi:hypothetical protein FOPG_16122 [Fusarium oxysporum f. sp. conglutinans race 2 54008]|uniref:Uncharacterized protein n=1 Tax=Fusarium oxysporum f. sp. conglutinans race 2 54008 TaxID=1089457 RepID=X0I391_FUSOX|nr:hypothetical protein FOPG_16122 [Fusarium oxysporum f. sp. conglutinans race 2 54008]
MPNPPTPRASSRRNPLTCARFSTTTSSASTETSNMNELWSDVRKPLLHYASVCDRHYND